MVSAQINGRYLIYIENTSGMRMKVMDVRAGLVGPGGSSEGVIANTPEKWSFVPLQGGNLNMGGYKLIIAVIADAAATTSATAVKHAWQIPITIAGQGLTYLGPNTTDFNTYLPVSSGLIAGQEQVIGIHTAPEGRKWKFGGGKIWMSVESNA